MTVHEFITLNQGKWNRLETFVQQASRWALARVPLDDFQVGSLAYRQTISDLAYARMRFPDHPVVRQLESLLGRAHSVIYQAHRSREKSGWKKFLVSTWPALVHKHARMIAAVTAFFFAMGTLGYLLTTAYPQLEGLFVSPEMRASMQRGELWTEGVTKIAPQASSAIATNNISVSLASWALGVTCGLGTLWLLTVNGLMLGVIFAACARYNMDAALAEFVIGHGSLELPAIWISCTAGLLLGKSMVFPGRYARGVEIRLAARESAQLMLGTVPMLLVAGFVEGFISPSHLPAALKVTVAVTLALAYVAYIIAGAMRAPAYINSEAV